MKQIRFKKTTTTKKKTEAAAADPLLQMHRYGSEEYDTLNELYMNHLVNYILCRPVCLLQRLYLVVVMCRAGQLGSRSRTRLCAEWSTPCVKSDLQRIQTFYFFNPISRFFASFYSTFLTRF